MSKFHHERHPGESRYPAKLWTPAFAGVTIYYEFFTVRFPMETA